MNTQQRDAFIEEIRGRFQEAADPERAKKVGVFFKSNPPIWGTPGGYSLALGRELARRLKTEGEWEDVLAVAEALYASGYMEEGACADEMLGRFWKRFSQEDWDLFEHWIDLFTCWGTVDSFCVKVLGYLVLRDGPPMERLHAWAASESLWHRRASLASLIRAAREPMYVQEIYDLADRLLSDRQDLIQKVIGWTLKELCKGDVEATISYLRTRGEHMTRLAFNYACEKMTPEQKGRARESLPA